MVETILMKSELTTAWIEAGRRLVVALETRGPEFDAGFWLLDGDSGRWNLALAMRLVKVSGAKDLYAKVDRILHALALEETLWIGMISIAGARTPIVQRLRSALGKAASVDGARLDDAFINGIWLPGCLIYRLSRRQKLQPEPYEVSAI